MSGEKVETLKQLANRAGTYEGQARRVVASDPSYLNARDRSRMDRYAPVPNEGNSQ
jgi:hypothetical protein